MWAKHKSGLIRIAAMSVAFFVIGWSRGRLEVVEPVDFSPRGADLLADLVGTTILVIHGDWLRRRRPKTYWWRCATDTLPPWLLAVAAYAISGAEVRSDSPLGLTGLWIVGSALLTGGVVAMNLWDRLAAGRKARRVGLCTVCSYDLRGLATSRCPECGNVFSSNESAPTDDQPKPPTPDGLTGK